LFITAFEPSLQAVAARQKPIAARIGPKRIVSLPCGWRPSYHGN
jgi:hypothetical protein